MSPRATAKPRYNNILFQYSFHTQREDDRGRSDFLAYSSVFAMALA